MVLSDGTRRADKALEHWRRCAPIAAFGPPFSFNYRSRYVQCRRARKHPNLWISRILPCACVVLTPVLLRPMPVLGELPSKSIRQEQREDPEHGDRPIRYAGRIGHGGLWSSTSADLLCALQGEWLQARFGKTRGEIVQREGVQRLVDSSHKHDDPAGDRRRGGGFFALNRNAAAWGHRRPLAARGECRYAPQMGGDRRARAHMRHLAATVDVAY